MRINKYVAQASGLSRRSADIAIIEGRVLVNGEKPTAGYVVADTDTVTLDRQAITPSVNSVTIMLHKPAGYVVSRDGQGSHTVYDLLPADLHNLKPVGRLDKHSTGLLLLTNDGKLAHELTHPSRQKQKIYQVTLFKPLEKLHQNTISGPGVELDDGMSRLGLKRGKDLMTWTVWMSEGRNRQIRRTFETLGYTVNTLHRTHFGDYTLPATLQVGQYRQL